MFDKDFKEASKVFKKPKKVYYFGKVYHGTPYFWPRNYSSTIVSAKKLNLLSEERYNEIVKNRPWLKEREGIKFSNYPTFNRNKSWIVKLFSNYYYVNVGWPIKVGTVELGWKIKYDSVRYEWPPMFYIFFFGLQFCIWWKAPDGNDDLYYEMIMWYLYYADKDIVKAKETWGWIDSKTKESTWNDNYLI